MPPIRKAGAHGRCGAHPENFPSERGPRPMRMRRKPVRRSRIGSPMVGSARVGHGCQGSADLASRLRMQTADDFLDVPWDAQAARARGAMARRTARRWRTSWRGACLAGCVRSAPSTSGQRGCRSSRAALVLIGLTMIAAARPFLVMVKRSSRSATSLTMRLNLLFASERGSVFTSSPYDPGQPDFRSPSPVLVTSPRRRAREDSIRAAPREPVLRRPIEPQHSERHRRPSASGPFTCEQSPRLRSRSAIQAAPGC